jgi:peptide/nickel transport system substrate-binding protein
MTAADAAASLARWGRVAGLGKTMWKNVTSVEPSGPNTLVIALKAPSGVLLSALARPNNGAVIYPKDVIDAAGDGPIKQFIGTGPFRFVEHKPDRHIKLARFADYAARKEASDGYGGARNAYVDEINFVPVPDVAVRLAGVETGEYHYAQRIQQDQYARIQAMPAVAPRIAKPYGWVLAGFNHKQGLMTDKKIRQAFQAALDMEPILAAAFGSPSFYRLDPALMFPEQSLWHSTAGAALYNQKDKAKAKRLLAEAGYKGQPVRWLTTREYEYMYKNAIVAKQQLEEAGFTIDLQIVDWATLMQRRGKPELYDVFSTGLAFSADPTLHSSIDCNYPATGAGWCQEAKTRLLESLMSEVDPKKRRALWEQLQKAFYDEAIHVKYGDYFTMDAVRKEVRGVTTSPEMHYWNVWLAR